MKQDTLFCTNHLLYRFFEVRETRFSSFFVIMSSSPKIYDTTVNLIQNGLLK